MSTRVLIVSEPGEEDVAELLARPLREAEYEPTHHDTILVGESWSAAVSAVLASGGPVILCGTKRTMGATWTDRLVHAAFNSQKSVRVFPVRMESGANVERLSLDIKIADYSSDSDKAITQLLQALRKYYPPENLNAGFSRVNFQDRIDSLSRDFTGRQWFIQELDSLLEQGDSSPILVIGEPGIGKSACAARFCVERPEKIAAMHFCEHGKSHTRHSLAFVDTLVQGLKNSLIGFDVREREVPYPANSRPSQLFQSMIIEPLSRLQPQTQSFALIFDSPDESRKVTSESILDIIVEQIGDLPNWIIPVLFIRPDAGLISRFSNARKIELNSHEASNREDLDEYIRSRWEKSEKLAKLPKTTIPQLLARADGNFLYAILALRSLENAELSPDTIGRLPIGLHGFFVELFRQKFPKPEDFLNEYAPLLSVLTACREPLPFEFIANVIGSQEIANQRLLKCSMLLQVEHRDNQEYYSIYHEALRDWLSNRMTAGDYWCRRESGHNTIAHTLLTNYRGNKRGERFDYLWKFLPEHIVESSTPETVFEHIDASYLELRATRHGHAVLEDVEWLARGLIKSGNVEHLKRCVESVQSTGEHLGSDFVFQTEHSLRFQGGTAGVDEISIPASRIIEPVVPEVVGLDIYAAMIPQYELGADFMQFVVRDGRLLAAIGDAPGTGLKSSFMARLVAGMFQGLGLEPEGESPALILEQIQNVARASSYFDPFSMQCIDIDLRNDLLRIASAGHPQPVRFSSRYEKCDLLPVRGQFIGPELDEKRARGFEMRRCEFESGDVLVLMSDGILEDHYSDDAFAYRFKEIMNKNALAGARRIGIKIIEEWVKHTSSRNHIDDASLIIIGRSAN